VSGVPNETKASQGLKMNIQGEATSIKGVSKLEKNRTFVISAVIALFLRVRFMALSFLVAASRLPTT
jgi:hypothetical protein